VESAGQGPVAPNPAAKGPRPSLQAWARQHATVQVLQNPVCTRRSGRGSQRSLNCGEARPQSRRQRSSRSSRNPWLPSSHANGRPTSGLRSGLRSHQSGRRRGGKGPESRDSWPRRSASRSGSRSCSRTPCHRSSRPGCDHGCSSSRSLRCCRDQRSQRHRASSAPPCGCRWRRCRRNGRSPAPRPTAALARRRGELRFCTARGRPRERLVATRPASHGRPQRGGSRPRQHLGRPQPSPHLRSRQTAPVRSRHAAARPRAPGLLATPTRPPQRSSPQLRATAVWPIQSRRCRPGLRPSAALARRAAGAPRCSQRRCGGRRVRRRRQQLKESELATRRSR